MRILLIGAYGFIGSAIARRLVAKGHEVRAFGRDIGFGARSAPALEWVQGDLNHMTHAKDWGEMLDGIDAVVNASGALQSGGGERLGDIQLRSIVALIDACETAGVARFVQISAPGAMPRDDTAFLATKGKADARLMASRLRWAILRPTLVIGRDAYGGTLLIRSLAAQPWLLFLVHGEARMQTVALADVARAVTRCLRRNAPAGIDAVLSERVEHSLKEVVLAHRRWLGLPAPRKVVALPAWLARPVSLIADALGAFGWRSPLRSTTMAMVGRGVTADPASGETLLERPYSSLDETLAAFPSGLQDRWQARLVLLLPLILGSLALLWLSSGIIGLARMDAVTAQLAGTSLSPRIAWLLGVGGGVIDIALGFAILFRRWARSAALGMVAVTLAYLLAGSVLRPDLWLDPLAPLMKAVPALVLALVAAALLDKR